MNVGSGNSNGLGKWRRYAVGAGAVAALLTTAACGAADASEGRKPSELQSTTTSASTAPSSIATPSASTTSTTASARPSKPTTVTKATESKKPADSSVELCGMADLRFTVTDYDAPGEAVQHLMLVATNTSATKCEVANYPEVTLGNAQGPAPVKAGADSGEVVTLAPGEKAYAGVRTFGGKQDTYTVKFIAVGLGSPGGEAPAPKPVRVKMPVTSFEADDGQRVSSWAGTEGMAMRPITDF
ncbi:DUF4232 domain-containing protein [Kribbella sp. NPDC004875]|uniref:DUF4232 domain-containing protein n=1 Tax=Kribbella sp. NPDC004875 TaxID=3364107 RepID=UPI0036A7B67E